VYLKSEVKSIAMKGKGKVKVNQLQCILVFYCHSRGGI
jgi:hypothetical protein